MGWVLVLGLSAAGCAPAGGGPRLGPGGADGSATGMDGGTQPPPSGSEATAAACSDGMDNDGDNLLDCDDSDCRLTEPCTRGTNVGDCEARAFEAEEGLAPVDIVWIIDSSGSMSGEAAIVQNNMNTFAMDITEAGLDAHVVVITDPSYVSVPPPLGTDAEHFLFVNQPVGSNQSLMLLDSEFSRYSDFLRSRAMLHFVIVSDDESDMDHATFQSTMEARLGRTFKAHVIVSPPGSTGGVGPLPINGCSGPNGRAADNGEQYWTLAGDTGGERFSICTEDWSALFDTLSTAIAIPQALPCSYEVPEPPADMVFDPMQVNVVLTPMDGAEETIPFVGAEAECDGHGWYYDDPADPSYIEMCPATCTRLESTMDGRVDIALGCQTIVI